MAEDTAIVEAVKESSVSGIILAGGQSRRMGGVNKALLEIGGRRIIDAIVAVLGRIFHEVIVVTNKGTEFEFLGLPMFGDLKPNHGALGGLYTGLQVCSESHGFLVACDMPFLDERIIRHMVSLVGEHDVVVPRISGHLEPLHAIYSRRCIPYIESLMEKANPKITGFFADVDLLEVPEADLARIDPSLRFALNVNTPEDLEKASILVG